MLSNCSWTTFFGAHANRKNRNRNWNLSSGLTGSCPCLDFWLFDHKFWDLVVFGLVLKEAAARHCGPGIKECYISITFFPAWYWFDEDGTDLKKHYCRKSPIQKKIITCNQSSPFFICFRHLWRYFMHGLVLRQQFQSFFCKVVHIVTIDLLP